MFKMLRTLNASEWLLVIFIAIVTSVSPAHAVGTENPFVGTVVAVPVDTSLTTGTDASGETSAQASETMLPMRDVLERIMLKERMLAQCRGIPVDPGAGMGAESRPRLFQMTVVFVRSTHPYCKVLLHDYAPTEDI